MTKQALFIFNALKSARKPIPNSYSLILREQVCFTSRPNCEREYQSPRLP